MTIRRLLATPVLLLWFALAALGVFHGTVALGCAWNETAACINQQTWTVDQ